MMNKKLLLWACTFPFAIILRESTSFFPVKSHNTPNAEANLGWSGSCPDIRGNRICSISGSLAESPSKEEARLPVHIGKNNEGKLFLQFNKSDLPEDLQMLWLAEDQYTTEGIEISKEVSLSLLQMNGPLLVPAGQYQIQEDPHTIRLTF